MISERDASFIYLREKSIRYLLEKDAKIRERQRRADECEEQIRKMTEAQNGETGA